MSDAEVMASRQYVPQQVRSVPAARESICEYCGCEIEEGDPIAFYEPEQKWYHLEDVEEAYEFDGLD